MILSKAVTPFSGLFDFSLSSFTHRIDVTKLKRAATRGGLDEQYSLACKCDEMCDYQQAYQLFQAAARKGHTGAMYMVAQYLEDHIRLFPDERFLSREELEHADWLALQHYQKAAQAQDIRSMERVGRYYRDGERLLLPDNVSISYNKACKLKRLETIDGVVGYYQNNSSFWRIDRDGQRALTWYMRAARLGDAESRYQLALLYRGALGIAADVQQSQYWLAKAMAAKSSQAQHAKVRRSPELMSTLIAAYETGVEDVPADAEQVAYWRRALAEHQQAAAVIHS